MSETLYVIDLYSLLFQVFHAIPEMTGPRGQPTNAVFGFTRDILNLLRQKQPTHLIVAKDPKGPGAREGLYPEYKIHRAEMPESLQPQVPMVAEIIEAFGLLAIEVPQWEADDVIATVVEQAASRDMEVNIVTNDKDARQLLGPKVKIYHVRKNQYLTEQELLDDWGVRPDQVIDFQSLVGDPVDNVPGVPLIGPKKATALLQQFGTLDEVLAHADQAPGAKLRENLKLFADKARLSKQLVTLRRDLPVTIDWDAARIGRMDVPRLMELFNRFGFKRFGDEVRALTGASPPVPLGEGRGEGEQEKTPNAGIRTQGNLFAASEVETSSPHPLSEEEGTAVETLSTLHTSPSHTSAWQFQFHIVDTQEKLAEFAAKLSEHKSFCLDLETTHLDPLRADIVGWAISWEKSIGWYLPVRGPAGQATLVPEAVVAALQPILENPAVEVVNQNIKYDMLVLRRVGIHIANVGLDPMVGHYLLDAGARSHSLDTLSRQYLQHDMIPITDLIGKGSSQKGMQDVDIPRIAEYAAEDAAAAWEIAGIVATDLRQEKLWDLYWNLERPLIEILAEMQHNGIRVDVDLLQAQSRSAGERLEVIQQQIYGLANREFNIDSPIQLRQILFTDLALPVMRKTKTGASTDQEVLEQLASLHPLPAKILEHRGLSKLKSTYLDALPMMVNPDTGRIHTSFNQVVAATGRLSSSEPNLQNIPIRTEEGRRVREAFVAPAPDWRLLSADYSQVELRMLAHFCGDEALLTAFEQGIDIHTAVAAEVYGVDPEAVDAEMRRVAKAVNFGVIYGQSPFGLANHLGISQDAAAEFIDGYFTRYAGVEKFLHSILEECKRTGQVRTILGRRRPIEGIRSTTGRQRNLPERTAINTVIQGSAADLIKQAMLNVHRRLLREQHPARMLLQIHDELLFETPADRASDLAQLVREEMESALELKVPIKVDVSVGSDWLNLLSVA